MTLAAAGLPVSKDRAIVALEYGLNKPESALVIHSTLFRIYAEDLVVAELALLDHTVRRLLNEAGARGLLH